MFHLLPVSLIRMNGRFYKLNEFHSLEITLMSYTINDSEWFSLSLYHYIHLENRSNNLICYDLNMIDGDEYWRVRENDSYKSNLLWWIYQNYALNGLFLYFCKSCGKIVKPLVSLQYLKSKCCQAFKQREINHAPLSRFRNFTEENVTW